jgi:hypothetical protein
MCVNQARTGLLLGIAIACGTVLCHWTRSDGQVTGGSTARPLSWQEFTEVRQIVKPLRQENPWNQVHWVPTLWEAHEKAVKEGKPIVVFTTGGEPLGIC